jgi:exonuclease VII small subunit
MGILALAAVSYFGPMLREQEPNYYNPARTALVNARLRFEESLGHEQALITQLQMVREELDSAITQLDKAADLDPADRARIKTLRSSLLLIEPHDGLREPSSNELHQSYRDLLAQMDALITDLDNRSR